MNDINITANMIGDNVEVSINADREQVTICLASIMASILKDNWTIGRMIIVTAVKGAMEIEHERITVSNKSNSIS